MNNEYSPKVPDVNNCDKSDIIICDDSDILLKDLNKTKIFSIFDKFDIQKHLEYVFKPDVIIYDKSNILATSRSCLQYNNYVFDIFET